MVLETSVGPKAWLKPGIGLAEVSITIANTGKEEHNTKRDRKYSSVTTWAR